MRKSVDRRQFLALSSATIGALSLSLPQALATENPTKMKFGLVTYLWGQHMDLPTVIAACQQSGLLVVELRTQHKHGVEPTLNKAERAEVKKRFADSYR